MLIVDAKGQVGRDSDARLSVVGIVVIGRNEGERLRRCLRSLSGGTMPVVYVDSGSSDDSVAFARSLGVEVVLLDQSVAFTAARARNVGADRLREMREDVGYVQFVDGDCELDGAWIGTARRVLDEDPSLGAVCGHLRERSPEASIYNRLADLEWRRPVGEVPHCGGIFMVRADVFRRIGGFDPSIAAGEEPDLCCRLREAGLRVARVDHAMAVHDLAMTRFAQWWRRSVRGGYGALKLTLFGPGVSRGAFRKQVRSALAWGVGVPIFSLLCAAGCLAMGAPWPALASLGIWPTALLLQAARLTWRGRRGGLRIGHAAAFAVFTVIWKTAAVWGFARCLIDHVRGLRAAPVTREFHKTAT